MKDETHHTPTKESKENAGLKFVNPDSSKLDSLKPNSGHQPSIESSNLDSSKQNQQQKKFFFWKRFSNLWFLALSKFVLAIALRGITVPGLRKIESKLTGLNKVNYDRKKALYEMRSHRYAFGFGPIWLKKSLDYSIKQYFLGRVWLSIVIKIVFSIVAFCLPIGIFILIRGVFPSLKKVPHEDPTLTLESTSFFQVHDPYLGRTQEKESKKNSPFAIFKSGFRDSALSIVPTLHPDDPLGVFHVGIGVYPSKISLLRSKLFSENFPLVLEANQKFSHEKIIQNVLKGKFLIFPKKLANYTCKIDIINEDTDTKIYSSTVAPPAFAPPTSNLLRQFLERFVPQSLTETPYKLYDFSMSRDRTPKKLKFVATVEALDGLTPQNLNNVAEDSDTLKTSKTADAQKGQYDLSNDLCVFAAGNFRQEEQFYTTQKRRGMIFIVVDTLNFKTSHDKTIFKNVWNFFRTSGVDFTQHRAQGNMTIPSISSLFYGKLPREIGPLAFAYGTPDDVRKNFYEKRFPTLPSILESHGYRVGAIGNLSLISELMEGGLNLGFNDVTIMEAPQFETRHITEESLKWIQTNGHLPFFLYLHYHSLHGPFRPDLTHVNLSSLISSPFGLHRESLLYDGLARGFDDEFGTLMSSLEKMGIKDSVDIILTADHGAQIEAENFGIYDDLENGLWAATRDKGYTLNDSEIKVPFFVSLSQGERKHFRSESALTSHMDIFTSLQTLLLKDSIDNTNSNSSVDPYFNPIQTNSSNILAPAVSRMKTYDLLPLFLSDTTPSTLTEQEKLRETLNNRSLYFEGHSHAGVLKRDVTKPHRLTKYVQQFSRRKATVYLNKQPFAKKISWFEPEQFSKIDTSLNSEVALPSLPALELNNMRATFNELFPSETFVNLRALKSQEVKWHVENFKGDTASIRGPDTLVFKSEGNRLSILGKVNLGDEININKSQSNSFEDLVVRDDKFIGCPSAMNFSPKVFLKLEKEISCLFFAPSNKILSMNFENQNQNLWIVSYQHLESKNQEIGIGGGGGIALQNAIKAWGYGK